MLITMSESDYWQDRYCKGNMSGIGSIGKWRKWKWDLINKYVNIKEKELLDIGCGDISFMKRKNPLTYTGIDLSSHIIDINRKKEPKWNFLVADSTTDIKESVPMADVVFAMDLLFHIMDDRGFCRLLNNLNHWTREWLFVSNWSKRPSTSYDERYQCFRSLKLYLEYLPDLDLIDEIVGMDGINTLYVFKRKDLPH